MYEVRPYLMFNMCTYTYISSATLLSSTIIMQISNMPIILPILRSWNYPFMLIKCIIIVTIIVHTISYPYFDLFGVIHIWSLLGKTIMQSLQLYVFGPKNSESFTKGKSISFGNSPLVFTLQELIKLHLNYHMYRIKGW